MKPLRLTQASRRTNITKLLQDAVDLVEDLSYWLVDERDQHDIEKFLQRAREALQEGSE
jgi:hypothetical protein